MKSIETAKKQEVKIESVKTIGEFFESLKDQIAAALPAHLTADRLARIALTAIRQNPELATCSKMSLAGAVITAAQLGLELNTPLGHAYMIPRNRKVKGPNGETWIKEAMFQMGYQGIIDLAYRSGRYSSVIARNVYQNDDFDYDYGIPPRLHHKPAAKPEGQPIYYYAIVRLVDGGYDFSVWSREQVIEHAKKFSDSFSSPHSPWVTNFDAMARKTVIISLLKYAQKSPEVMTAISVDRTVAVAKKAGSELLIEYDYSPSEESPVEEQKVVEQPIAVPPEIVEPKKRSDPSDDEAKKLADLGIF